MSGCYLPRRQLTAATLVVGMGEVCGYKLLVIEGQYALWVWMSHRRIGSGAKLAVGAPNMRHAGI
jgi:hypothetical protein